MEPKRRTWLAASAATILAAVGMVGATASPAAATPAFPSLPAQTGLELCAAGNYDVRLTARYTDPKFGGLHFNSVTVTPGHCTTIGVTTGTSLRVNVRKMPSDTTVGPIFTYTTDRWMRIKAVGTNEAPRIERYSTPIV
ncbi:hypothetical protein [Streptomyces sp. NPDC098781]|uniref:hypothetical protein n=1 Tax=Streptomyces sp. NPDC098781 TaxID=3366097 RepID=UPI0037F63FF5